MERDYIVHTWYVDRQGHTWSDIVVVTLYLALGLQLLKANDGRGQSVGGGALSSCHVGR